MSNITIQKAAKTGDRSLPIFKEAEDFLRQIRERAYGIATARGRRWADPLQDWLAAEREFSWSAAELLEREKEFDLSISLPGFQPAEIAVTATPSELIVHAKHEAAAESKKGEQVVWSDFRSNEVHRRFGFPKDIDAEHASASLENGVLKVVAPKLEYVEKSTKAVPVT